MTHQLEPTEYIYRGHWIRLDCGGEWHVTEDRNFGDVLFASNSIDDCTAMIDGVLEDM